MSRWIPAQQAQAIPPKMATSPIESAAKIAATAPKAHVMPTRYSVMTRIGLMLVSLVGGWVSVNG